MSDPKPPHPISDLARSIQTVREWLEQQQGELAKVLLPSGMNPARFTRIALTTVLRNPRLGQCSRASFILAVMEAAQLGLEPDNVSGLAYLVPFGGQATLIVGYRGLIQLAYRHPRVIEMAAHAVYEGDAWQYEEGLKPKVIHHPIRRTATPKPEELVACYATAKIRGGGLPFKWMFREEIETHRARSRARDEGPWLTDYEAMALKTPVRTLAKFIPQSPALMQALATDADPEAEPAPGSPPVPHDATTGKILDAIAGEETVDQP